jgi:hypothetical protein
MSALSLAEASDIYDAFGFDPHAIETSPGILEANESAIEQVVYGGSQKDPIFAIEPLVVVGIAPRLPKPLPP